jgi:membrane-associated phospholipid phosphatase
VELRFNMAAMNWLADHRAPWLTPLMQSATMLGEVQGYILISTLIYVMFDKRLAVRLALLVTLTMCLNHVVKILVRNPRPFVREGDYLHKWAVPPDDTQDLAREYSTPSGHAMGGASFYTYLFGSVKNRGVRIAAVLAVLLIGMSRPYLGVHYVEDILLGWAVGFGVGLFALRYGERISQTWMQLSHSRQIVVVVVASLALWAFTVAMNGGEINSEPRAFLGYAGTITGIVIAQPLELRFVDFDPRSSPLPVRILRYVVAIALSLLVLESLGRLFAAIAANYSIAGYLLQYVRYIAVSIVSLFVAPWIFVRCGLARVIAKPE